MLDYKFDHGRIHLYGVWWRNCRFLRRCFWRLDTCPPVLVFINRFRPLQWGDVGRMGNSHATPPHHHLPPTKKETYHMEREERIIRKSFNRAINKSRAPEIHTDGWFELLDGSIDKALETNTCSKYEDQTCSSWANDDLLLSLVSSSSSSKSPDSLWITFWRSDSVLVLPSNEKVGIKCLSRMICDCWAHI